MKKYILVATAICLTIITMAFTVVANNQNTEENVFEVLYRYDGPPTSAGFEDEENWVEISNTNDLECGPIGNICWILYTDQGGSIHPPTLPVGFDPYLLVCATKE